MSESWVDRILSRERVSGEQLAERAEPHRTFEDFFENELPGIQNQEVHVPGSDAAYTVTAFLDGNPLNNVGTAIVAGIIGTERYGLEFEVVTELARASREENPWTPGDYDTAVHDHVFLQDSYGRIFGGCLGLPAHQTERLPPRYLDGLHAASLIADRRSHGKEEAADELYAEMREHGFTDSEYINHKLHSATV